LWACRFSWAEVEFDSNGNLTGVICISCTTITWKKKFLVPKANNLEKHEGKRTYKEEGVPFLHLKKGKMFVKEDYKHVKNCKLWALKKNVNSMVDQLTSSLESDFKRKGVQFSTLLQLLSHSRPMCDYERQ